MTMLDQHGLVHHYFLTWDAVLETPVKLDAACHNCGCYSSLRKADFPVVVHVVAAVVMADN
jgi:hypothetical protein